MLQIVADKAIAHVSHYFSGLGQLQLLPADQICAEALRQTDILLVRSVTKVNQALLGHTKVRWVGTMTSGIDHIDQHAMHHMGIPFAHAPGCNASAVAEYVLACIAACMTPIAIHHANCAGIIGFGHAGQHVARLYRALGWQVMAYDPPKASLDTSFVSASLKDLSVCDVVSVHASLHDQSPYPSRGLINKQVLQLLKPGGIFINASRGDVCAEQDLITHGKHLKLCLDVWHHEPNINPATIAATTIATPHIAGHSDRAKLNATQLIYTQLCQALKLNAEHPNNPLKLLHTYPIDASDQDWTSWVKQVYNPTAESHSLHSATKARMAETFIRIRGQHQRKSFSSYEPQRGTPPSNKCCHDLGFDTPP